MKNYKRVLALVCAGLMGISMMGCGGDTSSKSTEAEATPDSDDKETVSADGEDETSSDKKFKIGIQMKTLDSGFFVTLAEEFTTRIEELGWEATVANADSDTMKESGNMDTFITQGYDLIFIDPYETEGCVEAINRAVDAGIPVICMDNSCGEAAKVVSIVYPSNVKNGLLCGSWVAANRFEADEQINSVCMGGQKDLEAARERRMGFIAGILMERLNLTEDEAIEMGTAMEKEVIAKGSAVNEDAKFSVGGIGWGAYTSNGGLDAAEDLVVANPDMNLMFGENDAMLLGAMTAIENAGLSDQVILAADADGQKEALELIKSGTNYACTGNNQPGATAEAAMEIAVDILVNGADPTSFDRVTLTNPACINPDNVDEYYDPDSAF
ncbi:substrate-binding domain-containing protein [Ruminococcus gauvreauii]|uniref:Substrate-binding domain-containing protein n=1 Tax=Ruminococcus gauvreauii TaxID=438033 RepID=A0ABY5VEB8_9FIRM|nr:substrate-binding domain-containing protein [Ruminococcus gauvreauii]UWP58236.1 substrate-binding domain-containing protein [Ruminococcus gauvreauii]